MGDTLQTATPLPATSQIINDSLSSTDLNDYFRFTLGTRSSFNLTLRDLTADANLQLLDGSGSILQASTNSGQTAELINKILDPGTYYIRVFSANTPTDTSYTLSLMVQSGGQVSTLWRDYTTGENTIWAMGGPNNTSPVSSVALPAVSTNWAVVAIADWNQDGISDLIWREYVNGLSGVWLMGNDAQLLTSFYLPTDAAPNWYIYGVADFNGDEALDLLWRDDSGDTAFWLMGGTNHAETMAIVMLPNAAPNWLIGGVADFDGDGNTDLFWHDSTGGLNGFWWMQGTALVSTELSEYSNHPDARVQGIIDFDQDGNPDILWRMPDGDNLIWFMEGTILKSTGSFITSSNLWITPFVQGSDPIAIDPAGNTTAAAFQVGNLTGSATYNDRIDASDPEDYFQFTLASISDLSLALSGLPAGSLQVLDGNGTLITTYTNLAIGTYFVRIYNGSGDYTFSLTAAAPPPPPPPPLPTVSISSSSNAAEPSTNGSFTITRTGSTDQALTVSYAIAGTATPGSDYQTLGQSVLIPAGQGSVTVPLVVIDDSQQEDDETVTLTLTPGQSYTLGTAFSQTITIADDDLIVIPPGDAGNTLATAKNLGTVRTTPTVQSDRVDASDKKDYYKITLATSARLRATVTGLTADLDIELLDSTGYLIDFSDNSGIKDESISRILPAGVYYLFVYPYSSAQSNYTLNVWKV